MNKFKNIKFLSFAVTLALLFSLLTGCTQVSSRSDSPSNNINKEAGVTNTTDTPANQSLDKNNIKQNNSNTSSIFKVHFINVGQADSILIQDGKVNMLVDAGNNADSSTVINYLKRQKINNLDYVIGTHPHEDHIGGLDEVIKSFSIGKIYMPKVSHTTKTFMDVVNAIKSKGLKITTPTPGSKFTLDTANTTILAPNSNNYEDLNNNSIVLKLAYKNTSFLLEGDAEDISENEMINKGYDLAADVLKVGHHGSSSSTTTSFLNKVNPKYSVIMTEKGNSYGHPHKETMDKLKSKSIKVYRTDENGTIIATSDGKIITFNSNPSSYTSPGNGSKKSTSNLGNTLSHEVTNSSKKSDSNVTVTLPKKNPSTNTSKGEVYFTPKGKSYHSTTNCRTLSRSKTILSGTVQEAISSGHGDPCNVCIN
ncbi:ComEC/Rec2 family competence protein [Clostridium cylindrosporum]|uniref:ComE operon protein 3 n=1 Tax=Clostridium cylindrosporum DSM 605 TaxID=1121307 RepID=A0A0J8G5N1_CLOCY|nr:MBL fold metallo-hydrolase [Clostridium cylindrosporum]KMT22956.1 ComE operon protein 3 [Clostridium cylindrosporum DSM 605]